MARKSQSQPTPTEVEILRILWETGPLTVREVHQRFGAKRAVGYTGVLRVLQNMLEKGLVRRNEEGHAHIYEARDANRIKRQLLADLVRKVFAGSASQLVLHLLANQNATSKEIEEIERMVAEHRNKPK